MVSLKYFPVLIPYPYQYSSGRKFFNVKKYCQKTPKHYIKVRNLAFNKVFPNFINVRGDIYYKLFYSLFIFYLMFNNK